MRRFCSALAIFLTLVASKPALACMGDAPLVLGDVAYADLVIIGRVADYHVVAHDPSRGSIWDYARFTVDIDEVLMGDAPVRIDVTWDNSTFSEPEEMPAGPFLIALRTSTSVGPPLRGASATVLPNPDSSLLTVLQAPCSTPFIFASDSAEALGVRQILAAKQ